MRSPFGKGTKTKPDDPLRAALGDLELPSFPHVILDALDTLRDPEASASAVADALSPDPGATVRLLRLVNSASFARANPIKSVSQAVAIAGLGTVESMLLALGVNNTLPNVDVDGLDQRRFWRAAAHRGAVAQVFARELHPSTAGMSFTSGLLLDMAIPLLAIERAEYRSLLCEWHGGGEDLHNLELSEYGWSHDEVAARMCEEWKLPENIREAIGGHHGGGSFEVPPGVAICAPFREEQSDEVIEVVVTTASETYNVAPDRALELLDDATVQAAEIASMFA